MVVGAWLGGATDVQAAMYSGTLTNGAGDGAFIIGWQLQSREQDLYVPVQSTRNLPNGTRTNHFGYQLEADGQVTDVGSTTALMVSNAKIVDGMYRVPAGETATFFAISYGKFKSPDTEAYAMRLIEVPFFVGADREVQNFNPSELRKFTTGEVKVW